MLLFNQINPNKVAGKDFRSSFVKFFNPMSKIPFFGDKYNVIIPLFIVFIGFFTIFKSFSTLLKRASKVIKIYKLNNLCKKKLQNRISLDSNVVNKEKIEKGEKAIMSEFNRRKRKERTELMNKKAVCLFIILK